MSIKLIETLSNAYGISGFEDEVVAAARPFCAENSVLSEDSIRNLYLARKANIGGKPMVLLDGHSDELGFMVQYIMQNGLIKFIPIGSWVASNTPAHKVKIKNADGKYISGVITNKPIHFMTDEEMLEATCFDKLAIDVGACSKEEVENVFRIEVGAPIIPDVSFEFIGDDIMLGKAFDCRLGCAAVIEVINRLKDESIDVDITGVLSTQEEIGGRGAKVASKRVKPQLAIVFEGTPADDNFAKPEEAQSCLRKGPQVRHIDPSMVTSPRFLKFSREIAKKHGIQFQDAIRKGGGTNAGLYHIAEGGIPSIVIGIPVRYAHSHHCYSSYNDFQAAVAWAVEIVKALNQSVIETF